MWQENTLPSEAYLSGYRSHSRYAAVNIKVRMPFPTRPHLCVYIFSGFCLGREKNTILTGLRLACLNMQGCRNVVCMPFPIHFRISVIQSHQDLVWHSFWSKGMIPLCMTCMPFSTHRLSSQVLLSLWEETCYGTKILFPPRSWIPVGFRPCSRYRPVNVKHACHFPLTFAYRFLAFSVLGCEKDPLLTGLKLVCFFKCTRVSVCGMYFHSFSHFILIL